MEGVHRGYNENGQLILEGRYKDGEMEGLWKEYYENGQLKLEGYIKDGIPHGLSKFYDEDGGLISKKCYENGNIIDCE